MSHHEELHFLIAKYLSRGPCSKAAEVLIQELEQNEMIPDRLNWLGESFKQDYKSYNSQLSHVTSDHLIKLLEKLIIDSDSSKDSRNNGRRDNIQASRAFSLLVRKMTSFEKYCPQPRAPLLFRRSPNEILTEINNVQALFGREMTGRSMVPEILKPSIYSDRLKLSIRTWGHLSAVYCVLMDVSGKYIFTGADDKLVKIWSLEDGRLLFTLRGSTSEITDLAVNYENTILASSCNDKLIRVWCLRTGEPLATLNAHSGSVTAIFFCPIPRSRCPIRYLASTSTDGSCAFWSYTEESGSKARFAALPTLYMERMRPGHAQMICASFSAGGIFMAAGSADNNVRVYYMLGNDGPERILEVENHTDRVDSISWAHQGVRFISGSRDGTALVWRYEHQQWLFVRILCSKQILGDPPINTNDPKQKLRVTMVGWNADDSLVLTAISNFIIKVWNPLNGDLVRVLRSHRDEVYCVEPNPINPRVICTAGHDGNLFVWDIGTASDPDLDSGKQLFSYYDDLPDGQGFGAIFDVKWTPDGFSFAATDSHGHLMIFHPSGNEKFKKLPEPSQLFFHTDYRPLSRDAITNTVFDEQTQVEPHLMPPPFLVDVEGNPYPPKYQKLVPGRERCNDEQLIPNVAVAPEGFQEVIEGVPFVPFQNPRSNIEQLIAQLAAEQQGARQEQNENRPREAGVGNRRSGEIEGVRQSTGNWQAGTSNNFIPQKRYVIPKLSIGQLKRSEEIRHAYADEEEQYYLEQKRRAPPSGSFNVVQNSAISDRTAREVRSRRIRQLAAIAAEQRRQTEIGELQQNAREGVARPNPPQQEISVSQNPGRRNGQTAQGFNSRRRRARYSIRVPNSDHPAQSENETDRSESLYSSSDAAASSSSESSDSDWGGGQSGSPKKSNTATATTERRRTGRHASTSPPQVKQEVESDVDYEEPQPGPSSHLSKVKVEAPKPRPTRRSRRPIVEDGGLEDIDEKFRPSEWLSELMPKKSPYFPQLGDDLVYFRQGHDAYVDVVKSKNIYPMSNKYLKSLPWYLNPGLPTEVPVRLVGIKFEIKPPRLVSLKLAVTDWDTGELTGVNINNVVYHDVSNIVDFLVLRQVYDKSMRHNWVPGNKFRCLIDRVWWIGIINNVEPYSPNFTTSKYLCYSASWTNGDNEKMSPWDLEIIPDDFEIPETETKEEGIPASEEDLHSDLFEASARDWPPFGHQDAECQRIASLIENVMGLAFAEHFLTPVDLNKYPEYIYDIAYPIDLNTIKTRLENRFYRRLDALKFDIKHIALNAEQFNMPMTDIVKKARIIRDLCLKISSQPELTEVTGTYHSLTKNFKWEKATEELPSTSAGVSKSKVTRHLKNSKEDMEEAPKTNGRCSSRLRPRKNNKGRRLGRSNGDGERNKSWEEACKELLDKIWQRSDSEPFRKAVDPTEYPDYYRRIDTPMDLQSVKEDLLGGNYSTPQEFARDMRLIFSNSKTFNTDKHSKIHIMTIRLNSMFECQMSPILDDFKSRRNRSTRKREDKFITATPTKSGPSRATRQCKKLDYRDRNDHHEEEDDTDQHGGRRTRFGGRRATNYEEYGSGEEEQMEPEEEKLTRETLADRVKQSRRNSFSSSNGFRKKRTSNRTIISDEEEEEVEEEAEEEEEEDYSNDDHPGPSSRLRKPKLQRGVHVLRKKQRANYAEDGEEYSNDDDHRPGPSLRVRRPKPQRSPRGLRSKSRTNHETYEDEDDEYSNDEDQPGPASRLRSPRPQRSFRGLRSKSRAHQEDEDDYVDENQEEEEDEQEPDDDDDDEYNENDDHGSRIGLRSRKRKISRKLHTPIKRRRRRISSNSQDDDDDENEPQPKLSPRKASKTKTQIDRTINIRKTRSRTSQNYNEESDEEGSYGDIQVKVTVSSRGRVRRRKSYLAE